MVSPNPPTLQRFTKVSPCPNCGGHPRLPRGQGIRCAGYFASNGFFYCSREESAGGAPFNANANAYSHWLEGPCKCGGDHRTSLPALPVAPRTRPASGDHSANAAILYAEAQLAGERAARYLRYRGLSGEVPADWRYVSMLRHPDSAERFPALILPFRRGDVMQSVQRLYLDPDGDGKLSDNPNYAQLNSKLSLGPVKGAAIRLETDDGN